MKMMLGSDLPEDFIFTVGMMYDWGLPRKTVEDFNPNCGTGHTILGIENGEYNLSGNGWHLRKDLFINNFRWHIPTKKKLIVVVVEK